MGTELTRSEIYWRPATADGGTPVSRSEFLDRFADGLRCAGRLRSSKRLGTPAVLLSAGADSRGVLASLSDPHAAHSYTYFDERNPELDRATQIAKTIGAAHHPLRRTVDYYVKNAPETVRLSGGMWSIESGHHTGFVDDIWSTPGFGTLLTGCYADYLFKGISLNVRPKTFWGKALPIYELAAIEQSFHHPLTEVADHYVLESKARWQSRFAGALHNDDRYRLEYLRNTPLCRETDASGRLAMWRQFPYDPIMADSHLLDALSVQSIPDKLSGIAFGKGIARVTGSRVARIPNNNFSAPVGTGELRRVTSFTTASLRRKMSWLKSSRTYVPTGVATYGSWPNFHAVLHANDQARAWFNGAKNDYFYGILKPERARWDYETFVERDVVQLMRLFTLHIWRNQHPASCPA
jgi:asparagine synthase (glutamine-hydrolysing)